MRPLVSVTFKEALKETGGCTHYLCPTPPDRRRVSSGRLVVKWTPAEFRRFWGWC